VTISLSDPPQVVASELVNAMAIITTMSVVVTGLSAGLLASGALSTTKEPKPDKKKQGITWGKR